MPFQVPPMTPNWYWHQKAGDSVKEAMPVPSGVWRWTKKGRDQANWGQCFVFPSML